MFGKRLMVFLNTSVCETTDKRNWHLFCEQWCFAKEIPFLSTEV
jgi:hypothetical protein